MKKFYTEGNIILTIIIVSVLARFLYLPIPLIINVADGAGYVQMADRNRFGMTNQRIKTDNLFPYSSFSNLRRIYIR